MMDGSLKADAKTAADYECNVDITRRVVDMAHWIGASVEGELGVLARSKMVAASRRRSWHRRRGQPINC
jgi:fructose/tagatose bisphosphate aldolase